jgi:hypothetical protein
LTTWLKACEVLAKKEPLPLYVAVIEFVPTGRFGVVNLATPPLSTTAASAVVPFICFEGG